MTRRVFAKDTFRIISDKAARTCSLKKVYKSRIDADLAIAEIWAAKQRDLNKYRCFVCGAYHLTSRQKWTING
jgi:hypothetical protein